MVLAGLGLTGTTGAAAPAAPPAPLAGVRLFVAGHSFHTGIIPGLAAMAQAAGIPQQVLVGQLFVGGSRTWRVWEESGTNSSLRADLRAGRIDVLTLSPHRQLPDPGIEQFVALGLAGNPHLRVTLQQSWLPFDVDTPQSGDPDPVQQAPTDWDAMPGAKLAAISEPYYQELDQQVRTLNARYGKPVVWLVPTGRALLALRAQVRLGPVPGVPTQAALFRDRLGHPGSAVTLLNAYCHFAVIYRRSPVGLAVPGGLPDVPPADRAALNRLLQELAWAAVTTSPLSGVGGAQ